MRVNKPHIWIAGFSAVAVVSVAVVDMGRNMPGPLAAVHGRVDDLAGRSCDACHGGWTTGMTESCLECHALIEEHIETGKGLHGSVDAEQAQRCALCHSEHHGEDFQLVNRQSFAQASVYEPDEFEHELVGFLMEGKHLELECTECHTNAEIDVLPEGEHRFVGLDRDCAGCHEDPHEGQMGFSCTHCHGQESFEELASLGHEEYLPLVGAHGENDCRTCHAEGDAHALELLGARFRADKRACLDCHESPHAKRFMRGTARIASTAEEDSCVVCHEAEHHSFRDDHLTLSAAQHAASGFPLGAPHDAPSCEECHSPILDFELRYPGRHRDSCGTCHDDPHGGQFDEGPFTLEAGPDASCTSCHERRAFEPHAFTAELHAQTELELTGSHLQIECSACHVDPEADEPRSFHGTESECSACHQDAHANFFQEIAAVAPWMETSDLTVEADDCATCHVTTSFADQAAGGFDHATWTGFAVIGAHAQSSCESCHPRSEHEDETGRTFGRVAEHFGDYSDCASCHEDPHQGDFDEPLLPADVDGRVSCARCHVETSFRAFPAPFDHKLWTGFSLFGVHGEVSCSSCHAPLRRPDEFGRTWEPAVGNNCADCHTDPHGGQFDQAGLTPDCAKCHAGSVAFSSLVFNHDIDSYFRLGEQHRDVDCGACHKQEEQADGSTLVRYKPLGRECSTCHAVQEHVLRKKRSR